MVGPVGETLLHVGSRRENIQLVRPAEATRGRLMFLKRGLVPWIVLALVCLSSWMGYLSADAPVRVIPNWGKRTGVSKTVVSMEVCVEPPMRRSHRIHNQLFNALENLDADYLRFSPWYPYPKLAVAELKPPRSGKSFWNFSLLDPIVEDFVRAAADHPVVFNQGTTPEWMFKTVKPVLYPGDPDAIEWNYEEGSELRDPTGKEVADYFARMASWYTKGGFKDEYGKWHASGHHYRLAYWEVLNEVDGEHHMSPQFYTRLYDAIVAAIREIDPQMKFVGIALAQPMKNPAFFRCFLDHQNHRPGTPINMISYHFYATPQPDESPKVMERTVFDQADGFIDVVGYINALRDVFSPETRTYVDEIGTILGSCTSLFEQPIPGFYWNLSGAMFAYVYAHLATMGIDMAAESELIDYPGQCAGTTMDNWKTGKPNARYWILKLLRDNFSPGDRLVSTVISSQAIYAQGFITPQGGRRILFVNKRDRAFELSIPGGKGAHMEVVDQTTASGPARPADLSRNDLNLPGLAVAVVTLAK